MNPDQSALDQFDLDVRVTAPSEHLEAETLSLSVFACSLRCTIVGC
ncbi:FDLD family class I lanthipeptide [Allokutzneria oryzae]|uniref:FDLD family class I lanthipeptide n=1 Tax=Allokutzneria oryzae TaxID=1378989 RepID=A0ABV5ZSJ4_9PSEU